MKVLVTRPAAQAAEWVARLVERGIDALALPLLEIAPAPDEEAVRRAWQGLATRALVVFVSPSAVERFFALQPAELAWPAGTLAGSIGPGTTRALQQAGVPASQITAPAGDAAQFDSESLWKKLQLQRWVDLSVLFARGDGGRDWLADRLREAGARVEALAVYRRGAPAFDATQRAVLEAAWASPAAHLWFFSSSEAIDHLETLSGPRDWAAARALATHPRIAQRARALGIGAVHESRAEFEAVVACILAMSSDASAGTPP